MNYYNDSSRECCAWLRELIKRGLIPDGEVDERDMRDVDPDELAGYRQLHFCAGVGTWAYALRQAGWADDRPVVTFSLPCQPFSAAGKRKSHEDERHLWPTMFGIIRKLRPVVCLGEQVASRDGLAWFDAVSSDLEAENYAIGAVDICAAGFGAPHIRQRLYFCAVGNAEIGRREGNVLHPIRSRRDCGEPQPYASGPSPTGELADAEIHGSGPFDRESGASVRREEPVGGRSVSHLLVHAIQPGLEGHGGSESEPIPQGREGEERHGAKASGPCNGFWSDAEWIPCRDGKARATKPTILPLADGIPGRVGILRGAGNAIVAPVAEAFIRAYMEIK